MASVHSEEWKEWERFMIESEKFSGLYDPDIPESENHDHLRHVAIVKTIATASSLVHPFLINSALVGRQSGLYRTGIGSHQKMPLGRDVPQLVEQWYWHCKQVVEHHGQLTLQQKEAFALASYFELFCLVPFKEGNGRTARLAYNHLRTLMGLSVLVIEFSSEKEHWAMIKGYRNTKYAHLAEEAA